MKIFGNDTLRAIDKITIERDGVSSIELVERAAEAITNEIMSRWRANKKVSVFAGPGNNGADALAVSRMLIEQGYTPEIYLFNIGGNHLSKECAECRDKLREMDYENLFEVIDNFSLPALGEEHLVIDGLFGSGAWRRQLGDRDQGRQDAQAPLPREGRRDRAGRQRAGSYPAVCPLCQAG